MTADGSSPKVTKCSRSGTRMTADRLSPTMAVLFPRVYSSFTLGFDDDFVVFLLYLQLEQEILSLFTCYLIEIQ